MGCFSYTCGISNLPIIYKDKVRYMLLSSSPYTDDGPTTKWFPRTFPLKGTYNDYGSVENIKSNIDKELWHDGLKLDLLDQSFQDWDTLLKKISRSSCTDEHILVSGDVESLHFVSGSVNNKSPLKLSHIMIREDVWQELLKIKLPQTKLGTVNEFIAEVKKIYKDYSSFSEIRKYFYNYLIENHVPFTVGFGTHFKLLLDKELPAKKISNLLKTIGETLFISQLLRLLTIEWSPSQSGPQEPLWNLHKETNAIFATIAEKEKNKNY